MAIQPIDLTDLTNAVTEAEQGEASVETFIQGVSDKIAKAVADAIAADDAADQGTADAAKAAIADVTARLKANSAKLAAAIAA